MTITVSGILKNPQGVAIQNAEIVFEQTQTSAEVVSGSSTSTITSATGQYSFPLAVGTYLLKIRQASELTPKVVASNIIVLSTMGGYSINQILVDQAYMESIDQDLLEEVFQARDDQAQSAQAAQASQQQAKTSETNSKTSETNAKSSENAALSSKNQAQTSEANALASENSAQTSQTTATTKATEASGSQTAASNSQTTATTKATEAASSATLAQDWAAKPENQVVSGGLYSALHYAAKAAQSASSQQGQLIWRGGWSAQAGNAPPTPTNTQDFYRITQAGTILSVTYQIGDYIHWDTINSIWFKMDGTDSVVSVNGLSGAVVLTQASVGALQSTGGTITGTLDQNIGGYGGRMAVSGGVAYLQGGKVGGDITDQKLKLTGINSAPLTVFDIWTQGHGIAMANGSKIFTESYKPKLDTTLGLQWVMPRPSGTVTWIRICSIAKTNSDISLILSALGDYGAAARNTAFINMASRTNVVSVDINGTNLQLYGSTSFYTKDTGSRFELWIKTPGYSLDVRITRLSGQSDIVHNDSSTSTDPGDLVLVTQKQLYSTGFKQGIMPTDNWARALKTSLQNSTSEIYSYDQSLGTQGWPWQNSSATIISTGWQKGGTTAGAELAINISGYGLAFRGHSDFQGLTDWKQVYHTGFLPTPAELGVLPSTGGTLTGTLNIVNEGIGLKVSRTQYPNIVLESSSSTAHRSKYIEVNTAGDLNIISRDNLEVASGNVTIPKNIIGTVYTTGNKPTTDELNTYNKATINEQSFSSISIAAPQGVEQGKYYPILVYNYGQEHRLYIESRTSSGGDPMNFCSFDGVVQQGGWTDTGNYVVGQFSIYSTDERQIHSILGPSEAANAYAIYVEASAFPITIRTRASATVVCTGQDVSYGTSVFTAGVTDPTQGIGTKTRVLADFNLGITHWYNTNSLLTAGRLYTKNTAIINEGRTDVGGLSLGGNIQGYAEIVGRSSNQSVFNYQQGLRYYSDDTWRVGDKRIIHEGDCTITGTYTFTKQAGALTLQVPSGQSSYILGTKQGVNNWWIGRGSASLDDVSLYSYIHNNYIELKSDRVVAGKNLYVGNDQVYHQGNKPSAGDVGAVATADTETGTGKVMRSDGAQLQDARSYTDRQAFRNKIQNGKFEISQRGTSVPIPILATQGTLDRFNIGNSVAIRGTVNQSIVDVGYPNTEIRKCLSIALTTPQEASVPVDKHFRIAHQLEGYDIRTLVANPFVLSFRAYTSKAGTYTLSLRNGSRTKTILKSYTLPSNTWTLITLPFQALPSDFPTEWENGMGLEVNWTLVQSSSLSNASEGAVLSGSYLSVPSQVVWGTTVSDVFKLTEVQLEIGTQRSPFEHRPFAVEMQLCQRYLVGYDWKTGVSSTIAIGGMVTSGSNGIIDLDLPVAIRQVPTWAPGNLYISPATAVSTGPVTEITLRGSTKLMFSGPVPAGATVGGSCYLHTDSGALGFKGFIAELI